MRAVKTVIAVAGNLKRELKDVDEQQICLRALRDVNVPKFLSDDLKLFNGNKISYQSLYILSFYFYHYQLIIYSINFY